MKHILIFSFLLFSAVAFSQSNKPVTENFEVGGTCQMCKERIERTLDVKGVKFVEYTLATHNLEITYVPSKISNEQIHQLLNAAGHDTAKSKASDEQYDKIHHCCKYRTHEHKDGEGVHEHSKSDEHDHDHEH